VKVQKEMKSGERVRTRHPKVKRKMKKNHMKCPQPVAPTHCPKNELKQPKQRQRQAGGEDDLTKKLGPPDRVAAR
jgi:hypothetical protein